jgi:hypothetical protein
MDIIEEGTMNALVREGLSEKKKIKDLFLVVVRSIDLKEQRPLVASLISTVSNLCYGNGKFRQMLKAEVPTSFFGTLNQVLLSCKEMEQSKEKELPRILVKHSLLAFLGNLTVD